MKNNFEFMKYKIGIYVRESRDDNEENYDTIETQRDLLIDFIKKNNWGEIARIYIDDNESGSAFERKGITQLTSDVKDNCINLLVLKDLSRLGRNNAKTLMFLDFLEEYAVRVITFDGRYDSIRDNDTVGIDTWYNERYVRDISKKIRANLRFKIEKGEYIGHAPYGYVKSIGEKNRLCIDKDTAEVVKQIFKLYLGGYGYTYISKILNNQGIPTPSMKNGVKTGGDFWNAVAVKRILFNRVYIGHTIQGVSEKISFKSKKTRRLPPEKWIITENTHEGIISQTDFEEVNKIHQGKTMEKGQHKGEIHLFKGMIYCGSCGCLMYARHRTGKPMAYICSSYVKLGKAKCSSHYLREDYLVDVIKKEIIELFSDESVIQDILEYFKYKESSTNNDTQDIDKLEKVISNKQKQQETLYLDKLEGKISEHLFLRINQNLETRIANLKQEIDVIRNKMLKKNSLPNSKEFAFDINNFNISNEIIKYLVDKIVVLDKHDDHSSLCLDIGEEAVVNSRDSVIIYFK